MIGKERVVARAEWLPGGNLWWSQFKVTVTNVSGAVLDNPVIAFEIALDQQVNPGYGLDWVQKGTTLEGRLVAEKRRLLDGESQEFTVGVRGNGKALGPLPHGFKVNGLCADPARERESRAAKPSPEPGDWDVPRALFVDLTAWPTPKCATYQAESGLEGFFLGSLGAIPQGDKKVYWGGRMSVTDSEDAREHSGDAAVSPYNRVDLQAFQARGGTAILSFGGASSVPLEAEETDVQKIAALYEAILRHQGVRHLDFAFEVGFLEGTAGPARHLAALSLLRDARPELKVSYTLPVEGAPGAPEGFHEAGIRFLRALSRSGIEPSLINGRVKAWGQTSPPEADEGFLRALQGMHRHLSQAFPKWEAQKVWRRMGVCLMLDPSPPSKAAALEQLRRWVGLAREKNLGCLSGADAARDRLQGFGFAKLLAASEPRKPGGLQGVPPGERIPFKGSPLHEPVRHALGLLEAAAALERKARGGGTI
ncbi:hypothetical protein POL68_23850 [Stigmatella sp. ncwal1]|uniref:Uncharacterized protein n=1 Tax=Stigmatella ashevillensis TaxID=2995309 RepID=A0ABT5DCW9_9BACT|nr:hypothetical protein [Stigmatella ashevillena]MDC0711525.1 hypothetical protein [Stigmatella ashevillena]